MFPTAIMIAVSSNNTFEEMSGVSNPRVHTSIQQAQGDVNILAEAEAHQSQSSHEHDPTPDIEIVEETREELTW